jgi:transcriptional regulator with PAS, ATPase and Fis domain
VNIVNSKGCAVPINISTSVLKDENGVIIGGVETFRDISTIEVLRKEISKQYVFEEIISKNYKIQQILSTIPDIAASGSTVLIEGPSGSGKDEFPTLSQHPQPFYRVNRLTLQLVYEMLPNTLLFSF